MALELRIITPEEAFPTEIEWNHEEILAAVKKNVADYKNLVYTDAQMPEAKKDKADLNKFIQAMENKRKEMKRTCLRPYESFEVKMKEIVAVVNEAVSMIDAQIKEYEDGQKEEKRKEIEELFKTIGFQSFVTLDMIWDEKWLNKTFTMKKIEEAMTSMLHKIGNDVLTINQLPEFSFEALEVYKGSLDLPAAIQEGQKLADIQKRKQEAEEAKKQAAADMTAADGFISPNDAIGVSDPEEIMPAPEEVKREWIAFEAYLSADEARALGAFFKANNIDFRAPRT